MLKIGRGPLQKPSGQKEYYDIDEETPLSTVATFYRALSTMTTFYKALSTLVTFYWILKIHRICTDSSQPVAVQVHSYKPKTVRF